MILAAAAYIAGLFFASFFTIAAVAPVAAAAVGVFFIGRYCGMGRRDFIIAAVVFTLAAGYMTAYTAIRYKPVIAYDGSSGAFSGRVTDIQRYSGGKVLYTLKGRIDDEVPAKVTVYIDELEAEYGDVISIDSCTFSAPQDDYLYHSRDRLRSEGIFVTASDANGVSLERRGTDRIRNRLVGYREKVCDDFVIAMGNESGEFLAGMVFGQSAGIDSDTRLTLSRCGIAHIMAVSGLHVSIAAYLLMQLLKRLRRYIAYIIMNLFMIALIIMADSPLSAIRAAIMLDMMYAAGLFRRQNDTFNSLAAAVLLICITDPYAIYSAGFQISVMGTCGIGVAAPYFTEKMPDDKLKWVLLRSFVTMLCTMLCIMPLSMKYFDEVSLISPVTNVFIVPLSTVAMVIGLIYVFTGGHVSLLIFAKQLIELIIDAADRLSGLSGAYFSNNSDKLTALSFILAVGTALVQLILRKRRITAYAAAIACSIFLVCSVISSDLHYRSFRIAILGRNGNAAVVITYKGHTDVVDLSGNNRAARYVRKYLLQNGINNVDSLVLTDNVHAQYASYKDAMKRIDIENVYVSDDVAVYGGNADDIFSESGFTLSSSSGSIRYEEKMLTVEYGDNTVHIIPVRKASDSGNGLCVYYGNVQDKDELYDNAIYLDSNTDGGMNNFEIILSADSGHKLRRL